MDVGTRVGCPCERSRVVSRAQHRAHNEHTLGRATSTCIRRTTRARAHECVLFHFADHTLSTPRSSAARSPISIRRFIALSRNERGIIYALPPLSHPCADSLPPPHTPLTLALSRARRLGESFWDCSFEGAELPALLNCSTLRHGDGGATPAHRDGGTSPTLMILRRGTTTCGS